MPKTYGDLSRLSPQAFAAVLSHTLLVACDYLVGLGGYAEGEEPDGPENLLAAVAAEVRRRGLESGYEGSLSEVAGTTATLQPEDLLVGPVAVELTGLAAMRQRRTVTLQVATPRSAVTELARESAGNHPWDYLGMLEETIEVQVED